jgi:hypothetical protein
LAYQHNRPASNPDDSNDFRTDNLSSGHTTGLSGKHAVMMSVTLVWWLLVRIERNLQSIRGSLVMCFPAFFLHVQSMTVTRNTFQLTEC